MHGGAVANPINALARMIAEMHDADGRVTVPGFYDDVLALEEAERAEWRKLPFNADEYAAGLGLDELGGGEKALDPLQRRWARPTLDCNGIFGGHLGAGAKTIIPSSATAKITTRLVPHQDPKRIAEGFRQFLAKHTPPGTKATMSVSAGARPVLVARDSAAVDAAKAAIRYAFGREPIPVRCGATVPATELIQRLLGLDPALVGFGLPDDHGHGPNEHFHLKQLWRASLTSAAFMQRLAESIAK
jgi:acetylornithine deacetylase/succinyl-diaminopimelate desuccinylase-like protein